MSATEIINELPKLTRAERQAVLSRLLALARTTENVGAFDSSAQGPEAASQRLEEPAMAYVSLDFRARGIGEAQATDLRARLRTFAEDWDRPEAAIYDEDPAPRRRENRAACGSTPSS